MDLIFNSFVIMSKKENKGREIEFKEGLNTIIGDGDTGKTCLARSIFYTLGCDVQEESTWKNLDCVYLLDFNVGELNYVLVRQKLQKGKGKNYFQIYEWNGNVVECYSTKELATYLCGVLDIRMEVLSRDNVKVPLYPNYIFLPFYTDQDYSWERYLSSTFKNLTMINNYKKHVLEFFTGEKSNEYYDNYLEKTALFSEKNKLRALIDSKERILTENEKQIKIIENVNFEDFVEQFNRMTETYATIINTEHELKDEINKKLYSRSKFKHHIHDLVAAINKIEEETQNDQCPNCHQTISKSLEENYYLLSSRENLIRERKTNEMRLREIGRELESLYVELGEKKRESRQYVSTLNERGNQIETFEKIKSYGLSSINKDLRVELSRLEKEYVKVDFRLEEVDKALRNLNKNSVSDTYRENIIKNFEQLEIKFRYLSYYISNLLSADLQLSGASRVKAFIAQYFAIYDLTLKNSEVVNIPLYIDTFLKDDFDDNGLKLITNFIFSKLQSNHQSIVSVANNAYTKSILDNYDTHRITLTEKYSLLNQEYDELREKYKEYLN